MKTFKQFQSEATSLVIPTIKKVVGAGLAATGLTGMIMNVKRKRDVNKDEYDKLQKQYNDDYFSSPQVNPPEFDRVKGEYDRIKKENGKKGKS